MPAPGAVALSRSRLVAASPVYYGWVVVAAATVALALTLPGQTAGVALVASATAVLAYGAVFGLSQGLQNNLAGSAFAYYFGRAHVGAIKGFTKTLFVGGTALGPPLVALGEAVPCGYAAVLWGLAVVPLGPASSRSGAASTSGSGWKPPPGAHPPGSSELRRVLR